jgi:hypothetical protein
VFEREFGPLTMHERMDALIGQLCYVVHASAGGKASPREFMPRWRRPVEWTDEQIWKWLDAEAKRGEN